jgi:hypothetical protein
MSPEQLEKQQVDRRADVFAFGAVLHEMLTGERLFHASSDAETLHRVRHLQIEAPSKFRVEVPPGLDAIVLRALARDPGERFSSAVEMLEQLENLRGCASRREVLAFLGNIAPEVFATHCDGCGRQLPWGHECSQCRPVADLSLLSLDEVAGDERTRTYMRTEPDKRDLAPERKASHAMLAWCALLWATFLGGLRARCDGMRAFFQRGIAHTVQGARAFGASVRPVARAFVIVGAEGLLRGFEWTRQLCLSTTQRVVRVAGPIVERVRHR